MNTDPQGPRRFALEPGPQVPTVETLAEYHAWIERQFRAIEDSIGQVNLLDASESPPSDPGYIPRIGDVRYFEDNGKGYGAGPYVYRCDGTSCYWSPMFADGETWNDMKAPATAINPPGLASDPTFNTTEGYWQFADSVTNLLFITIQLSHGYKEGADIEPHVHWIQTASGSPLWRMSYKWYNNGDPYPAAFTDIDSDPEVFTYTSGNLAQISPFPAINGAGMKISSIVQLKLQRIGGDANDTLNGASANLTEFDIHVVENYRGSTEEFLKYSP